MAKIKLEKPEFREKLVAMFGEKSGDFLDVIRQERSKIMTPENEKLFRLAEIIAVVWNRTKPDRENNPYYAQPDHQHDSVEDVLHGEAVKLAQVLMKSAETIDEILSMQNDMADDMLKRVTQGVRIQHGKANAEMLRELAKDAIQDAIGPGREAEAREQKRAAVMQAMQALELASSEFDSLSEDLEEAEQTEDTSFTKNPKEARELVQDLKQMVADLEAVQLPDLEQEAANQNVPSRFVRKGKIRKNKGKRRRGNS